MRAPPQKNLRIEIKRLLTSASVIAASLLLLPTTSFGQMSDDYGFPIETENDAGRQSNFSGYRGSGLFGFGLFRGRANTVQSVTRRYQYVPQYCPPNVISSAPLQSSQYRPVIKHDVAVTASMADEHRVQRSSTTERTTTKPTILVTSRSCVPYR